MAAALQRQALRALQQEGGGRRALPANLPDSPYKDYLRRIRDEYPTFAAVSVDTERNEGQKTLLGRTMHGMGYDAVRDEIVVPQQFGQGILVFRATANGEEPPVRVIRGSKTRLIALDRVAVNQVNGEYIVPEGGEVLAFSRDANGDAAPIRILSGPNTTFSAARAVAVDTARNLLIVVGRGPKGGTQIPVFDRKASGDAKPLRVITGLAGPRTSRSTPNAGSSSSSSSAYQVPAIFEASPTTSRPALR